ncbi:MAG: hypothetical protein ABIP79_05680 [Chitinophagaceae bacterium]
MKPILVSSLLFLFAISSAVAQEKSSIEMETFYQNVMSKMNVRHVGWVKSIAKEANEKKLSIDDIRNKAAAYTSTQNLSEPAMEFLIGLAGKLAQGGQKNQISQLQSSLNTLKDQKKKLINTIAQLEDKLKPVTKVQLDSVRLLSVQSREFVAKINSNTSEPAKVVSRDKIRVAKTESVNQQVTQRAIDGQVFELKNDIDSLSETGEMISLRLQMYMDRHTKFMTTITNIFKKFSDTSSALIQNLK